MIETGPALVIGATGLTGRSVVAVLRERGIETLAHVRPDSRELERWRTQFSELGAETDVTPFDEAKMTARIRERGVKIVFALLGTTKKRGKAAAKEGRDASRESYEAVDYGLTAIVRRAAEASGQRPRFVYLSALGADESSMNGYYIVRGRLERELREGKLPYTIARPAFILGDRDEKRSGEAIGASALDGALGVLGALGAKNLRARYASINAEDLARGLVRFALDPSAEGRIVTSAELRAP